MTLLVEVRGTLESSLSDERHSQVLTMIHLILHLSTPNAKVRGGLADHLPAAKRLLDCLVVVRMWNLERFEMYCWEHLLGKSSEKFP